MMDAVHGMNVREHVAACVGLGEMECARLRLLMRLAGEQAGAPWRLGNVEQADLLFVSSRAAMGDVAVSRARAAGVRCVVVGGSPEQHDALPLPLELDSLIAVLKRNVSGSREDLSLAATSALEFFQNVPARSGGGELDAIPFQPEAPRPSSLPSATAGAASAKPASRPNPFLSASDRAPPSKGWSLEPHGRLSRRRPGSLSGNDLLEEGPPLELREYIQTNKLIGPSRLQLPGNPPLIIDPKGGVYYIEGDLAAVEPYLMQQVRRSEWQPVTNTQLRREQERAPGQPLERLLWLDALRRAEGWLPRHLDPGGTYRVKQVLHLGPAFEVQARIAELLLRPHRLHDVVSGAGVGMPEVFDVVAAYDAIGLIEWTPRERFR